MIKRLYSLQTISLAILLTVFSACAPSEPAEEPETEAGDAAVQNEAPEMTPEETAKTPAPIESTTAVAEAAVDEPAPAQSAPNLVVEEVNDLGEVENDGPIEFSFTLKNDGSAPLEILEIKPSCGCTEAKVETNTIEPGGSTTLTAALDLPNQTGVKSKSISLMTNDPDEPRKVLTVKADLVMHVVSEPQQFAFSTLPADEAKSATVVVRSTKPEISFNIERVEVVDGSTKVESQYFDAETEVVEAGTRYKVTLTSKPPLPIQVSQYGEVNIYTDNERYAKITVPYRGIALGALVITPSTLLLPQSQPGLASFTRNILVRPGLTQEFKVLGVEAPNDTIETNIVERPNIGYLIELKNIEPTEELQDKEIIIKTDVESMKEIRVPIRLMGERTQPVQPAG